MNEQALVLRLLNMGSHSAVVRRLDSSGGGRQTSSSAVFVFPASTLQMNTAQQVRAPFPPLAVCSPR